MKITGHLTINARWQGGRWVPGTVRWTKGYPSVIEGPALVTKVTIDVPESAFASLPVHIDIPEDALTVIEAKVQEADRVMALAAENADLKSTVNELAIAFVREALGEET